MERLTHYRNVVRFFIGVERNVMKLKKTAVILSITLVATSFAGCDLGKEQVIATTKDIPVFNEESINRR